MLFLGLLGTEAFTWAWVKAPKPPGDAEGCGGSRQAMVAGNCDGPVAQLKASLQACTRGAKRQPKIHILVAAS